MSPHPASYSTTTSKEMVGQVSKEGSTTLQVEGKDTISVTIYSRKNPPKEWLKKQRMQKQRGIRNCITKRFVIIRTIVP